MQLLKMVKNCAVPNKRVFLCLMFKSRLLLGISVALGMFAACEKAVPYDEGAQLAIDDAAIKAWIAKDTVTFTKHESGVYYKVIRSGTGTKSITVDDTLLVQYEGRVLAADSSFIASTETDTSRIVLNAVMPGWQKVVPLIKAGGAIRMIVPSTLAYRNIPVSYGTLYRQNLPPNSILDFSVNLRKVKYKK